MRTIVEASAALREGKVSSVELTKQCLSNIERLEPKLNAFITVTAEHALAQAKKADDELANGTDRGPLHGIPISLKDLYRTKGIRTTGGSLPSIESLPAKPLSTSSPTSPFKVSLPSAPSSVSLPLPPDRLSLPT